MGEREDIQKKTFAKWLNSQLVSGSQRTVTDLFYDLRDGLVLLDVLELLTAAPAPLRRERGTLRVHHLSNVSTVLSVLNEHRVKLVNINNVDVVDGNPKITLALVWAIILHWQFHAHVQEKSQGHVHVSQLERSLLAWCRQNTRDYKDVDIRDFTSSWQSGRAFLALLHNHKPSLFDYSVLLRERDDPNELLQWTFEAIESELGIPRLLDAEDLTQGKPDKKSVMTYLMCLFRVHPHQEIDLECLQELSPAKNNVAEANEAFAGLSSPFKVPIERLTNGKLMTYDVFCRVHEDVLEWLLDVEDQLQALEDVSAHPDEATSLAEVKSQFRQTADFMLDVEAQHEAIGKVQSEGQALLERKQLSSFEDKDVRVRIKLLLERWKAFRKSALARQRTIQIAMTKLQQREVHKIREWMTETEDRISRMGTIGASISTIEEQLKEHEELQREFEKREETISDFVQFETSNNTSSPASSPTDEAPNSTELEDLEQDLEGQIMALDERWTVLCTWNERHWTLLQEVLALWRKFEEERLRMSRWLDSAEESCRNMERSPTEETNELLLQATEIMTIQGEAESEKKRLEAMEGTADKLLHSFEPENEACIAISEVLELIQDRWGILDEILEAQKQRLSSLGLDLMSSTSPTSATVTTVIASSSSSISSPARTVSTSTPSARDTHVDYELLEPSSQPGEVSLKKARRSAMGARRIEFEGAYAKAISWLQKTGQELSQVSASSLFPTSSSEESAAFELYELLLKDLSSRLPQCDAAADLGDVLIAEITAQEDFPADYLTNIQDKVSSLKSASDSVRRGAERLERRASYLRLKHNFYNKQRTLHAQLTDARLWLDSSKEDDADVDRALCECSERRRSLTKALESGLADMKSLSSEATLHPGASEDPANRIKADVYTLCDMWESLDTDLASRESKLLALAKAKVAEDLENGAAAAAVQKKQNKKRIMTLDVGAKSKANPAESRRKQLRDQLSQTVRAPIYVKSNELMQEEIAGLRSQLEELKDDDAFSTRDASLAQSVQQRIESLELSLQQLGQFQEEVDGLSRWMAEVDVFLKSEEAAFGDLVTLEAQLKESNALQEDIDTLRPNVDSINENGRNLQQRCSPRVQCELRSQLEAKLKAVNAAWDKTLVAAKAQNNQLRDCMSRSTGMTELLNELTNFLDHLEADEPVKKLIEKSVNEASELSQRSYKLSQLKEKIAKRAELLQKLHKIETKSKGDDDDDSKKSALEEQCETVRSRWEAITVPILDGHATMREASTEYGEFKTLAAQESDWLERLEKKMRKEVHTAADAEEISEELYDLENLLNNHPEDRLRRLIELAASLKAKNVLIDAVESDAKGLNKRWHEVSTRAKKRTHLLEGSIAEAQAWEYKLLEVQDWLADKDMLLSSHLEQELTVDDLPDESQENLLSEMDEQVDAYRDAGKQEAAARLEDQLHLIHQRFQELLMKFELFQQQPAEDYEPRLGRVHRQLRDIRQKLYLTDLSSSETEAIKSQLHHAKCIYNALSDIKPEVENVIKMGRKIVEIGEAVDSPDDLTKKIDQLKADFNEVGAQITDMKKVLERALELSERLSGHLESLHTWFSATEQQLVELSSEGSTRKGSSKYELFKSKYDEMLRVREKVKSVQSIQEEFFELAKPTELTGLKESVRAIESKWAKVVQRLQRHLQTLKEAEPAAADSLKDFATFVLSPSTPGPPKARKLSEETPLYVEYRARFEEANAWLRSAEAKLSDMDARKQRPSSVERKLSQELEDWRPRIRNLRSIAETLVAAFAGDKEDVEPEMRKLGQKWDDVIGRVEERLKSKKDFKMVEVEEITTTISHLAIPKTAVVIDNSSSEFTANSSYVSTLSTSTNGNSYNKSDEFEVIDTLPEEESSAAATTSLLPKENRRENLAAKRAAFFAQNSTNNNNSSSASAARKVSPLPAAIRKPHEEQRESSLISSRDSSPEEDLEIVTGTMILQSNSPTFIKETVSRIPTSSAASHAKNSSSKKKKKVPPKTLPKPKTPSPVSSPVKTPPKTLPKPAWYTLDQTKQQQQSDAEKVTVSANVLPSPEKTQIKTVAAVSSSAASDHERIVQETENILNETNASLEEVKKKVAAKNSGYQLLSHMSTSKNPGELHAREVRDFEDSAAGMLIKMAHVESKLNQLDFEPDLRLRADLIAMEAKVIEAEAATLISRGDTLVLMTHRNNVDKAGELQAEVGKLRKVWQDLKQLAEGKAIATKQAEEDSEQFKAEFDALKHWMDEKRHVLADQGQVVKDEHRLRVLIKETEKKRQKVDTLKRLVEKLRCDCAFSGMASGWNSLLLEWEELEESVRKWTDQISYGSGGDPQLLQTTNVNGTSSGKSPHSSPSLSGDSNGRGNHPAGEIVSRIAKMREAVAAIDRQLKTQVLDHKQYENLPLQATALEAAKEALERLRPTVKKTAKDLEVVTGSLSVEYLEMIVGQSEKLRDEWQGVNHKYTERHILWTKSSERHETYTQRQKELDGWLEDAERTLLHTAATNTLSNALSEQHKIEKQVSERNKAVTEVTMLGKEIMHQTSSQEHVEIQVQIDRMLKRWKFILSQLSIQRDKFNRERLNNNVNYMSHWLDENAATALAAVNISQREALTRACDALRAYEQDSLPEKTKQMEKLAASSSISPDVLKKLQAKFDAFISNVPTRRQDLEACVRRLDSLHSRLESLTTWLEQSAAKLEGHVSNPNTTVMRQNVAVEKLRQTLNAQKTEVVDGLLRDFDAMETQVLAEGFVVDDNLTASMDTFKADWARLWAKCQSGHHESASTVASSASSTMKKELKKDTASPSSTLVKRNYHPNAPQISAALRDHRDWIRCKSRQLMALRLGNSVDSLQKQAVEHQQFKNELDDRRHQIIEDTAKGREISADYADVEECLGKLSDEWAELCEQREVWQNRIDNSLANLRIIEKDAQNLKERLSRVENTFHTWKESQQDDEDTESPTPDTEESPLNQLASEVNELLSLLRELKEHASRVTPTLPAISGDLIHLEDRISNLKEGVNSAQNSAIIISAEEAAKQGRSAAVNNFVAPLLLQLDFQGALPPDWERGVTQEQIPYYLCHTDERTQWDHPVYTKIMEELLNENEVKYSAYRVALKLRKIQKRLCLELLDLQAAIVGFDEHGLTPERHDLAIRVPEMALVLTSLYEALAAEEPGDVQQVALCVDLALNWLLNVYDPSRTGQIRVLSFKIGILLLCRGPLTEKYLNLFKLVARDDKKAGPKQLGLLLLDSLQVPKNLGEVAAFGGSNVEPSVRSCFTLTTSEPLETVDAKHFLKWLRQDPQSLVWLPVLHRLSAAEAARHNVKCKVCKVQPIVGFRYHCLKCFNFDLCQSCFFRAYTTKGHKAEHPMQEYCTSTGTSVNLKNLGQAFRNSFRSKKYFKKKSLKLGYLPVDSVLEGEDFTATPNTLTPNLSLESRELLHGSHTGSLQPRIVNKVPGEIYSSTTSSTAISHSNQAAKSPEQQQQQSNNGNEHEMIAKYCRALTGDNDDNDDDEGLMQEDLQQKIRELESENTKLSSEYELLQRQSGVDEDVIRKEAHELRQTSSRMETRMKILEDHNLQLEAQLSRLRQLLQSSEVIEDQGEQRRRNNFGTLQSKSVIAADLFREVQKADNTKDAEQQKRKPPGSREFLLAIGKSRPSLKAVLPEDISEELEPPEKEDEDSLGLSDLDTQTVSD